MMFLWNLVDLLIYDCLKVIVNANKTFIPNHRRERMKLFEEYPVNKIHFIRTASYGYLKNVCETCHVTEIQV